MSLFQDMKVFSKNRRLGQLILRNRIDKFVRRHIVDDLPPALEKYEVELGESEVDELLWFDKAALVLCGAALGAFWMQVYFWLFV